MQTIQRPTRPVMRKFVGFSCERSRMRFLGKREGARALGKDGRRGGHFIGFALSAVLVISSCSAQDTASTARSARSSNPSPTGEKPSQSAADAERDGVAPEIAAMPISKRVEIGISVRADEGVWVASQSHHLSPEREGERSCRHETPHGVQYTCSPEYGEVLLLEHGTGEILRAFPLPAVPPSFISLTDEAVYCARQGDGGLPDSIVCRIDRKTRSINVRVFTSDMDSAFGGSSSEAYQPREWELDDAHIEIYEFVADDRGLWAKAYDDSWARLDLNTLKIVSRDESPQTTKPTPS